VSLIDLFVADDSSN